MPIQTRSLADRRAGDARYGDLKQQLIDEWSGRSTAPKIAPDILEETDRAGRVVHVYVTWDEWGDLDAQTRSEMIVDAFQAVRGHTAVLELTLAMGLTKAESSRLGR